MKYIIIRITTTAPRTEPTTAPIIAAFEIPMIKLRKYNIIMNRL
jgi:hypothetical protein